MTLLIGHELSPNDFLRCTQIFTNEVGAISGGKVGAISGGKVGAISGGKVGAISGGKVGAISGGKVCRPQKGYTATAFDTYNPQ